MFLLEVEAELAAEKEALDAQNESADRSSDPEPGLLIHNELEPEAMATEPDQTRSTMIETFGVDAGDFTEPGIETVRVQESRLL